MYLRHARKKRTDERPFFRTDVWGCLSAHLLTLSATPSEVGIATGVSCYWGQNCPHHPQDLLLLGSAEVGMNKAGTTAKTSRNNVLILTEAPCLCASSTLAKFKLRRVPLFY